MDNKADLSSSMTSGRDNGSLPRPKVDMKHGFVRSIIQNQIERDEYHKMVVAMQEVEVSSPKPVKQNHENVNRPSVAESEVKPEASNKRASIQLYTPPHARGDAKVSKKKSPKADQTSLPDRPTSTPTSAIVSELAGENSAMRQRARDKLLRERKTNGSSGGSEIVPQQIPIVPSTKPNADQPLFRLQISTDEQGKLEDCIVYEGDTPARVAKRLVQKLQLSEANSRKIRTKVEEAMLLHGGKE